jgi:Replicative DNA helicase
MNNDGFDRLPPQDNEAEQSVLGAVFLSSDALVEAMAYLVPEDFYKKAHQLIFQAMMDLSDRDEAIDIVTIKNILENQNQLEDIGGISYIAELAEAVPTAANVTYYAKIVKEKAMTRQLINVATKIVSESYEGDASVTDLLDNAERDIFGGL